MPTLNLGKATKGNATQKNTSGMMVTSPNFGESALLSGGDDIKDSNNVDFFSASRSNNDLKDMLQTERTELSRHNDDLINFNER